jgi:hypothetical protein
VAGLFLSQHLFRSQLKQWAKLLQALSITASALLPVPRLNFAQTQLSRYRWARQEQAVGAAKLQNVTAVTDAPSRFWQLDMAQDMDQV